VSVYKVPKAVIPTSLPVPAARQTGEARRESFCNNPLSPLC